METDKVNTDETPVGNPAREKTARNAKAQASLIAEPTKVSLFLSLPLPHILIPILECYRGHSEDRSSWQCKEGKWTGYHSSKRRSKRINSYFPLSCDLAHRHCQWIREQWNS